MLQFYFLSIMLNLVTGMILVYGKNFVKGKNAGTDDTNAGELITGTSAVPDSATADAGEPKNSSARKNVMKTMFGENAFFDDKTFRLVLGILTMFVGLMKMLSVVHNDIPVVGDIIPALAGLTGGFCLLVEYYSQQSSSELKLAGVIQRLFVEDRKYIGYVCIAAAVLHFAFPDVLLL